MTVRKARLVRVKLVRKHVVFCGRYGARMNTETVSAVGLQLR